MFTIDYFTMLAGLTPDESAKWEPLCAACDDEIRGRIRASVDTEKQAKRLYFAAAILANYRYNQLQGGAESMKVGDFSYSQSKNDSGANTAFDMIGDLLSTEAVELRGI